ncbi:entericidin EcnA/B family protein [Roseovarius phycicola]|uniref:Entericidin EcnA/B family protein n=1 Tax=Roseovarius phycicola TaxID=3080976 RepID=A0ABZ2HGX4_9RHOB
MKKIALLALMAALAGCGTVEGIGRDLSSASRGVQNLF